MQSSSQTPESSALFVATIVATGSIAINAAIPGAVFLESSFGLDAGAGARIVGTFVTGYALGHILVGLLAQDVSQKSLLLVGLLGFIACSLFIGIAPEPDVVGWMRAGQGLCASTCPIIGRALVRQMGTSRRAAKRMSGASAIFTWAPVFAPLIAGALADGLGWRSIYFALAAYGSIGLIWVLSTPERQFVTTKNHAGIRRRLHNFANLFKDTSCRAGLISGSLAFAGFFSLLAAAPSLHANWTAYPVSLAVVVALFAAGYAFGAFFSRLALNFVDEVTVLFSSLALMSGVGLIQWAVSMAGGGVEILIGFAFIYAMSTGAAMPNATVLTMHSSIGLAPFALALLGMSKMVLAALITTLITLSVAAVATYLPLAMTFAGLGGLIILMPVRKARTV